MSELELIVSLMKQVTFILDMNEGTQHYFDVGYISGIPQIESCFSFVW